MTRRPISFSVFRKFSTILTPKRVNGLCSVCCIIHICKALRHLKKNNLAPTAKKEELLNLSSFSVKSSTLPEGWPCSAILRKGDSMSQSSSLMRVGSNAQEGNNGMFRISQHILLLLNL